MIRTVSKRLRSQGATVFVAVMIGAASIAFIASGCGTGVLLIRDCVDAGAHDGGGGGGGGGGGAGGHLPVCKN